MPSLGMSGKGWVMGLGEVVKSGSSVVGEVVVSGSGVVGEVVNNSVIVELSPWLHLTLTRLHAAVASSSSSSTNSSK